MKNGFFIPDLLITISIFVALAFVAIPQFMRIGRVAKERERESIREAEKKEIIVLCKEKDQGVEVKSQLFDNKKYTCS